MFWSLHAGTSTIDTLLSSEEGFTLEQLLDEDDLLQECKSQNTTRRSTWITWSAVINLSHPGPGS